MASPWKKEPQIPGPTCELLRLNQQYGGAHTTVDRVDPFTGQQQPMWVFHKNMAEKSIAVLYANGAQQSMNMNGTAAPAGTAKFHTFSSKIDITLRGMPLQMKGDDLGVGHKWAHNGRRLAWSLSRETFSSGSLFLFDETDGGGGSAYGEDYGRLLGRYRRSPDGKTGAGGMPTFELFVPPQSVDMDMVITTGLAAVAYWEKEKKDSIKAVGKIFGGLM